MTREMIKQIERDYWAEKADPIDMAEIFDLAIKALEQEPTTKNDLGVDCISRDDAIEVLKDWDGYFIGHSSDDVIKALNLAIKALEHPEKNIVAVVPCGDAVSRAEVLKLMKDNWHTHNGDWAMQESMDDIRALPSVTPQEPTDKIFTKADFDSMAKAINYGWKLRVNEVLDKIIAEIENDWQLKKYPSSPFDYGLRRVIKIIDKYKAENEPQESEEQEW